MRSTPLVVGALLAVACGSEPMAPNVVVHVAPAEATGVHQAAADVSRDLHALTGETVARSELPARCVAGAIHVELRTEPDADPQRYTIDEERCDDGHRVVIRGSGALSTQWGAYDFMERLGVRYFHPEQTYVPDAPAWPDEPFAVSERPDFVLRSLHCHRTHPLELSAPTSGGAELGMGRLQEHWIDWNVKLRHTETNGWDSAWVGDYAYERGFPRAATLNLVSTQQGGDPVLDPDDARPEEEQLAEAIDAAMATDPGEPPVTSFNFQFNPSEFTVEPEDDTLRRIGFVTDYVHEHWPSSAIWTINHGTHQEPGPLTGLRFFDLPELAPPALGVKVHPLMFYGLDRPAPVYGNDDFAHFQSWIESEQAKRPITWFPEGSWWLTFDLPVPLFLAPVTLEARSRDIEILRPWLAAEAASTAGVHGHHLFTSGQEWGFWMVDYCSARMAWDTGSDWQDCLAWITRAFAEGEAIDSVLSEVAARQVDDLRDPALIAMLVGSDDETEAGATAGIEFHPLPPLPAEVLAWADDEVASFVTTSLEPLDAMIDDYQGWAERVAATLPAQSAAQAPWVREIHDGLAMFALRARHSKEVYTTALALRAAIRAGDFAGAVLAEEGVQRAAALTEQARALMAEREADYRYPLELSIAGDELGSGGEVPNRTVYPYRVLSRAHRLFYWTRPDEQLGALFGAGLDPVTVNERILDEVTPLDVTLLADAIEALRIDWGDGSSGDALVPHAYPAQGFYDWSLDVVHAAGVIAHDDRAAVVARRLVFPRGSLRVTAPQGAQVLEGFLPGFVVGLGSDAGGDFLVTGRLDAQAEVSAKDSLTRHAHDGTRTQAADFSIALEGVSPIVLRQAVIAVADGGAADDRRLSIEGELVTEDVILLVVESGAFEEDAARTFVADVLGYTVATLPDVLFLELAATGNE